MIVDSETVNTFQSSDADTYADISSGAEANQRSECNGFRSLSELVGRSNCFPDEVDGTPRVA